LNYALARIVTPRFTADILIDAGGVVVSTDPELRWMTGNHYDTIERMCAKRKWSIEVISI
jgi:hypothetical protein